MKIQRITVFLLFFILFISCRSSLKYEDHYKKSTNPPIPVKVANLKKAKSVALIMPPDKNNIDWKDNSLVKLLEKNDYAVILTQNHSQNPFINKKTWISYAYGSYNGLKADSLIPYKPKDFLIIAFEDAGYTLPTLCELLKPHFYIAVNTGPYNPLKELELLARDTSALTREFYRNNNLRDKDELTERIVRVKSNLPSDQDLLSKTNEYWMSFYKEDLYQSILKGNVPGMFIYSTDYSGLTPLSKISLRSMIPPGPVDSTVVDIPGTGIFSKEEEMEALTKAVNIYINSLR